MDPRERLLIQIRIVVVIFRSEARRSDTSPDGRQHMAGIVDRSMELLRRAESELDGELISHPELVAALRSARTELGAAAA